MRDILHLLADGLVAAGTALSKRTQGFSEREAERYLTNIDALARCSDGARRDYLGPYVAMTSMDSATAGGEAAVSAATHVGYAPADVGRAPGERTSELLLASVNQLGVLLKHTHFDHLRESYLEELIPELRERAREFVLQGD